MQEMLLDIVESTGARETLTKKFYEGFKIDIFYPILDAQSLLRKTLKLCSPQCDHFLEQVHLKILIDN